MAGVLGTVLGACSGSPLPSAPSISLSEESGEALEQVPVVPRFRLSGLTDVDVGDVWLVEGEVSSASQSRIQRGEVPQTVESHRVPLAVWTEDAGLVLAPSEVLIPGQSYHFIALGVGLIGGFGVVEEERALLSLWGPSVARLGEELAYCVAPPPYFQERSSREGLGASSTEEACVFVEVTAERDGFFLPPASIGARHLEPTPIAVLDESEGQAMPPAESSDDLMSEESLEFPGGFAEFDGAAVALHVQPGGYSVELSRKGAPEVLLLLQTDEASQQMIGPLEPNTDYTLKVTRFFDGSSRKRSREATRLEWVSGAAQAHFVLTEVLADPLGKEPEAEWVELFNSGTAPASTAGLEIWDSASGVRLPDVELAPGQFGLIVRGDFSLGADEVPDPASIPLFVESLGANGLRNSGEVVELRTTEGRVLSTIPALSSSAGRSIARLDPWASDEPESFFEATKPTPGAPHAEAR